jgi:hypothetical protein
MHFVQRKYHNEFNIHATLIFLKKQIHKSRTESCSLNKNTPNFYKDSAQSSV